MTADARTIPAESDPVTAALADTGVLARLTAAAQAFLCGRMYALTSAQRAAEAEVIVSEARVRGWQKRSTFDPSGDVVSWLVGYVRNVAREHLKKYTRGATGPPEHIPELDNLAEDLRRPTADVVADKEQVAGLLVQLCTTDRELIELKYFEDLNFAEIGDRIGQTEGAVRLRHFRIIARLRKLAAAAGEVRP